MQDIVEKNQELSRVTDAVSRGMSRVVDLALKIARRMSSDRALSELTEAQRRDVGIDDAAMDHIEARSRPLIR